MSEDNTNTIVVEAEQEARLQGWVPKEEFRGDESEWVDATTFVKRGKEINPILKKNNERLISELTKTKKQVESLQQTAEDFRKFQIQQSEKKIKTLQNEIDTLRNEKREAISSGDGSKVVEIEEKIDELKEEQFKEKSVSRDQQKETKPVAEQTIDPVLEEWAGNNPWYIRSQGMATVTDEEARVIHTTMPHLKGKEFLDELDKRLEATFSLEALGRSSKRTPRNPVEGASARGTGKAKAGDHVYDNLPSDAKKECDRFVREIKGFTREKYCEDFAWE